MTANITNKWLPLIREGIDLNNTAAAIVSTVPEYPGQGPVLGDIVEGNNGSLWMLVQATTTITSKNIVAIDANFRAINASTALALDKLHTLGVAQFAQSAADPAVAPVFWACIRAMGGLLVNCTGTVSTGQAANLYVSGSGGMLATTSTGTTLIGVYINTGITSATAATDVIWMGPTMPLSIG